MPNKIQRGGGGSTGSGNTGGTRITTAAGRVKTPVKTVKGIKSVKKDIKIIKKVKNKINKPIKTIKKAYKISEKDRLNMVSKSNPKMDGLEVRAWSKHPGYASSLSSARLQKGKWSGPTRIKIGKVLDAKNLIKSTKKLNLPKKGKK